MRVANSGFRRTLRTIIPRRLRWVLRAIYRVVTLWYVRHAQAQVREMQTHLANQNAQLEAQGEVMDLMLRRLRRQEDVWAANVTTLEENLVQSTSTIRDALAQVQHQTALLRTHLSASGILGPMNMKARTLQGLFTEVLANTPPEAAVVEVGCMRYPFESPQEGASTLYLARWCLEAQREFISIELERNYVESARGILSEHGLKANFINGDGRQAILSLTTPIGLLYLDGSNDPGETIEQLKAAEGKLLPSSVIAIDDVQRVGENPEGKGEQALPYARDQRWQVQLLDTEPGFRMAVLRRAGTRRTTGEDVLIAAETE